MRKQLFIFDKSDFFDTIGQVLAVNFLLQTHRR